MPFLKGPDFNTHYETSGAGDPVVLIHGVGLNLTMWDRQEAALSGRYKVVRYDLSGHGQSDGVSGDYSLTKFADQLLALMDGLGIAQAHIVGFSLGGLIAQALAIDHSSRIKSLTIVSTIAGDNSEQRDKALTRVADMKQRGINTDINGTMQRWFTEDYTERQPAVIQCYRQIRETTPAESFIQSYFVFSTGGTELISRLSDIDAPTFLITGELDGGSTPAMSQLMHEQIAGSQLLVLPGIKHMLPVEAAHAFNEELLRFLVQIPGGVHP